MPLYTRANHTRTIDKDDPDDANRMGFGAQEIRQFKEDVQERMELEHQWANSVDTSAGDADGFHKKTTLKSISTPSAIVGAGILYTKLEGEDSELHYLDDADTETQLTKDGTINFDALDKSYVYVKMSADTQDVSSLATVEFDDEITDDSDEFNPATYKFTANKTGLYLVTFKINFYKNVDLYIYKNGVEEKGCSITFLDYQSGGYAHWHNYGRAFYVSLAATDYIEIKAEGYSNIAARYAGSSSPMANTDSFLSIMRV